MQVQEHLTSCQVMDTMPLLPYVQRRIPKGQTGLAPIQRGDVTELSRASYRVARGAKQAACGGTRVRTVLTAGMLGDIQRQVLVTGLTSTTVSTSKNTRDYHALEGNLEVRVGGATFQLSAGDRLVVPRGKPVQVTGGDASNKVLVSIVDADTTSPAPSHIPLAAQVEIDSDYCGLLRSTLDAGIIDNLTQVLAEGLTDTTAHSHASFTEDYLVTRGFVRLGLKDAKTGRIDVVELHEGDRVIMPAGTGHKVLGGSEDNQVLVTCAPGFVNGDETLCEALESFGRARAA